MMYGPVIPPRMYGGQGGTLLGLLVALLIACLGGLVVVWLFAEAISITADVPAESATVVLNEAC